jgi:hypothetical protein
MEREYVAVIATKELMSMGKEVKVLAPKELQEELISKLNTKLNCCLKDNDYCLSYSWIPFSIFN